MRWPTWLGGKKPQAQASATSSVAVSPPSPAEPETGAESVTTLDLDAMIAAAQALNLRKEKAYPLLYLDRSGSTNEYPTYLWDDGTMQLFTTLVAAVTLGGFSATTTKTAPLRFFNSTVVKPLWPANGQISRHNVNVILDHNRGLEYGGTAFVPVLLDMVRQALLINALSTMPLSQELGDRLEIIEDMSDADLLAFIRPQTDTIGHEQLRPILVLPHPILGFMCTDGLSGESLIKLLEILRWMSQIGIYVMLVGVGPRDFDKLKSMDKAGEALALQKGIKPLWDNVDFIDLKDINGNPRRLPDGPTVITLLVGKFMSKAYESCRGLGLIA